MSEKASPEVKSTLTEIDRKARTVQRHVSKGIQQYEKLKEDAERKEDLFLSLLSLQDYAAELSHMVKTTIGNIKSMAEGEAIVMFEVSFYDNTPKHKWVFVTT